MPWSSNALEVALPCLLGSLQRIVGGLWVRYKWKSLGIIRKNTPGTRYLRAIVSSASHWSSLAATSWSDDEAWKPAFSISRSLETVFKFKGFIPRVVKFAIQTATVAYSIMVDIALP